MNNKIQLCPARGVGMREFAWAMRVSSLTASAISSSPNSHSRVRIIWKTGPVLQDYQEVRSMLDHILATAQSYEREHGIRPNVLYLNPDHLRVLVEYYPALFERDPAICLEFRLVIVATSQLSHPQAAYVADTGATRAA